MHWKLSLCDFDGEPCYDPARSLAVDIRVKEMFIFCLSKVTLGTYSTFEIGFLHKKQEIISTDDADHADFKGIIVFKNL